MIHGTTKNTTAAAAQRTADLLLLVPALVADREEDSAVGETDHVAISQRDDEKALQLSDHSFGWRDVIDAAVHTRQPLGQELQSSLA